MAVEGQRSCRNRFYRYANIYSSNDKREVFDFSGRCVQIN